MCDRHTVDGQLIEPPRLYCSSNSQHEARLRHACLWEACGLLTDYSLGVLGGNTDMLLSRNHSRSNHSTTGGYVGGALLLARTLPQSGHGRGFGARGEDRIARWLRVISSTS